MPVPDFSPGEVLTAAAMDAVGLWLVKTQTVGTGVSSVTVTGAFSSAYDNYRVTYIGGTASADGEIRMTLGSAATGYYQALPYANYSAGSAVSAVNNGTSWSLTGSSKTTINTLLVDVFSPFLSVRTSIAGIHFGAKSTGVAGAFGGFLDNSTSYTAFTLAPSTGTLTGGIICVYGYRN